MTIKKNIFVDPLKKEPLKLEGNKLSSLSGNQFTINNNIPDLIYPEELPEEDFESKNFYEGRAKQYDETLHLTFFTHDQDEKATRKEFINKLEIDESDKILEIACGTGRDSEIIAGKLNSEGELHITDISEDMLRKCQEKLQGNEKVHSICQSNAMYLPFPDNYFNATYSFGAMGEFSDKAKAFKEMVRVTKLGGKVVVGDESVPVWHRNTKFYKILKKTNPMFAAEVPFDAIPVQARDVNVSWVIGGTFYLIDFKVGEGEPDANFDFQIPGVRGGTYRTRYEGDLEGVNPETKELAWKAVLAKDTNMHEWLDAVVKEAAKKDLKNE